MLVDRMTVPVLQRQFDHFLEIILRQSHLALEDRDHVLALQFLRAGFRPVALEAKLVRTRGPQQVRVVSAMRFMAGRATLNERRLMHYGFLHLLGLIRMAGQASLHGIGLQESWRLSAVGVMAGDAIALRTGVLHLRRFDLLSLLLVARQAESPRVAVG